MLINHHQIRCSKRAGQPQIKQANRQLRLWIHRPSQRHEIACSVGTRTAHTQYWLQREGQLLVATAVLVAQLLSATPSQAASYAEEENFENIPSQLQAGEDKSQKLSSLFSGEKRREVEGCTRKCVPTCVRGGGNGGAPGLGPISLRKEIVVFKEGFRSRSYCLSECANVCSLSINGPRQ